MKGLYSILFLALLLMGCAKDQAQPTGSADKPMYFPEDSPSNWQTISPAELKWNQNALDPLKEYLAQTNSRSFIVLVNGRIALEYYFHGQTANSPWEWNSAGKTLVSATVGIAEQEGLLDIHQPVSDYLGSGWTNMAASKEDQITMRNLLTMTSGIDDSKQLIIQPNLTYVANAGTRWAYSNVFQKLIEVVDRVSSEKFEDYFNRKLADRIGMDGQWNFGYIFTIYHSTARSMARFGLLALNEGKWKDEQVINPKFFKESISSSQEINPSYGYLWWLNGKSKYMVPGSQKVFSGPLIPNAPADIYAAMGAQDQRIYVVPSRKMVVVRMGGASNPDEPSFAVSGFDSALWEKINAVIR